MPSCSQCPQLSGETCLAYEESLRVLRRPIPPPPLGACALPIVQAYLAHIKQGHQVLEIGCGTWSAIREHCQKIGAHYEGIDVQGEYYGEKVVATRLENLAQLSYSGDRFDFVIGNQTMEHWAEHGCTMEWGLYQCYRVLKPGGRLLLNVPIHFHGTMYFVHGQLDKIRELFARFSGDTLLETWGNPSSPITPFYAHPNFAVLREKPAYVLDIQSRKDRSVPDAFSNRLGFHGKLAQLFHYSFSYNWYRLLQKMGIH